MPENCAHPTLETIPVAKDMCGWIFFRQRRFERAIVITQIDSADSFPGGGNEQPAQRARHNRVANAHPPAAAAIRGGGHAKMSGRAFVEPAA
jgi:hypothetical protein